MYGGRLGAFTARFFAPVPPPQVSEHYLADEVEELRATSNPR